MQNKYIICDNYTILYTTKGKEILIDTEDLERVLQHTWSVSNSYPQAKINKKVERLHRFLMNPTEGKVIDHIDGNILDNRKNNLRICTYKENRQNSRRRKEGINQIMGVAKYKGYSKWRAYICTDGKTIHLGMYEAKEDAIKAREEAEKKYWNYKVRQTCDY